MNFLFTIVLLAIAGYVLYSTVTGKGKLFSVDNILEEKIPQFIKLLRPLYLVLGVIMLVMALTSGFQNVVYADVAYRFTDDFKTYYADNIDAKGNIKGTEANIDGLYGYNAMSSVFGTLPAPEVPDGVNPSYAEAATDENGEYLFMGIGETFPGQNETYASLRNALSYHFTQILTWVMMGLAVVLVVLVFVLINKFTDKEKQAKAKAQARSGGAAMPSSAFEFEDESSEEQK